MIDEQSQASSTTYLLMVLILFIGIATGFTFTAVAYQLSNLTTVCVNRSHNLDELIRTNTLLKAELHKQSKAIDLLREELNKHNKKLAYAQEQRK